MNINTPQTYCVTAELNVLHGIAPHLAQKHLQQLAQATRLETGCLHFEVHCDMQNERRFILWECFADEAAFKQHFAEKHTADYLALNLTEVVQHWFTQPV